MLPEPTADTTVTRIPGALTEDVLGETVILDVEADRYTRLNRSGAVLWAGLEEPATVGQLAGLLVSRFGLEPQRALADAGALVQQLAERGLVGLAS